MKKKFYLGTLFCSILVITTLSCSQKNKNKENGTDKTKIENTGQPDTLTFSTIQMKKVSHLANKAKNPACTYELNIVYPSGYPDTTTLKGVQKLFLESVFGASYADLTPNQAAVMNMKEYIENYQSEMAEYLKSMTKEDKEAQGADAWMNYESYDSTIVTYNRNRLFSYNVYTYSYTGGAHGIYGTSAYIIDLETIKTISFQDIFTEKDTTQLKGMLKNQLAKDQKVKSEQALKQLGFWTDNITPDNNFFVTGKGITWIYNPYEIAPYVMGTTEITLGFAELKPLIKSGSPVFRILKP